MKSKTRQLLSPERIESIIPRQRQQGGMNTVHNLIKGKFMIAFPNRRLRQECKRLHQVGLENEFHAPLDAVLVTALPLPGPGVWRDGASVEVRSAPLLIGVDLEHYPKNGTWFDTAYSRCAIHVPHMTYERKKLTHLCDCDLSDLGWCWLRFESPPSCVDLSNVTLLSIVAAAQLSLLEGGARGIWPGGLESEDGELLKETPYLGKEKK